MAKKDRPSKYLAQWIVPRKPDDRRSRLGEDPPPHPYKLSIRVHPLIHYQAVQDAFLAFDLDPGEPEDWEKLIIRFCEAHFVKRGAPRTWGHAKLGQLAADFARAKAANPGIKKDKDIRERLVKDKDKMFGGRYRKYGCETIRRKMPAARKELAKAIAECKRIVEMKLFPSNRTVRYPASGAPTGFTVSLTPAQEKQLADWTIEKYSTRDNPWPWKLPLAEIEATLRGN
jgi:hypothetical protein